jgi:hypothetical protein
VPTTTYKLGRDAVTDLPGVENCNIVDVTANVSADQLDVTTYGATALTAPKFMAGLVDVSIDVTCTATTANIGDRGPAGIVSLPETVDAVVLEVKRSATPQGKVEFTVTYGLVEASAGD